jgi:hypothetical protein
MTILRWILLIWIAGWFISACAYAIFSIRKGRLTGLPRSPLTDLLPLTMLLFTWLPSLILYIVMRFKALTRRS